MLSVEPVELEEIETLERWNLEFVLFTTFTSLARSSLRRRLYFNQASSRQPTRETMTAPVSPGPGSPTCILADCINR